MVERPAETRQVGSAQSQLALPLNQVQLRGKFLLQPLDDAGRAVRRPVVDDQHVIIAIQRTDGPDDLLDVLFLVVRRDDDDFFVHGA